MLRSAERYFDAALAAETLRVLVASRTPSSARCVEARDRFTLGDVPVTDTHEATARAAGVRAEVLAARDATCSSTQAALADVTGLSAGEVHARWRWRRRCRAARTVAGAGSSGWPSAKARNLQLRVQSANAEVAQQEAAQVRVRCRTDARPRGPGRRRTGSSGSGDYGTASNTLNNALIGVQLNGAAVHRRLSQRARRTEAQRLADKAVAEARPQARSRWR